MKIQIDTKVENRVQLTHTHHPDLYLPGFCCIYFIYSFFLYFKAKPRHVILSTYWSIHFLKIWSSFLCNSIILAKTISNDSLICNTQSIIKISPTVSKTCIVFYQDPCNSFVIYNTQILFK